MSFHFAQDVHRDRRLSRNAATFRRVRSHLNRFATASPSDCYALGNFMTSTSQATAVAPPAAAAPSMGWVVRRALLGLALMLSVTALAAFIFYASIDASADDADASQPGITIGTPAAKLLTQ